MQCANPTVAISGASRFVALDAFRGIGAVAIACFHIHRYGPLPEAASEVLPDLLQGILGKGWMAVQMFLVLAGFVTAFTLRNARITPRFCGNFAARRVVRLGVPYWAVIFFVLALSYPAIDYLHDTLLTEPISWQQLFASLFFLQDILGYGNISAGMWFVCIDMQFGLLLPLMLGAAQLLALERPKGSALDVVTLLLLFLPLAVGSMFVFRCNVSNDMWIYPYFFMPVTGILAWWALEGRVPRAVFWGYVILLLLAAGHHWRIDTAAVGALASSSATPRAALPFCQSARGVHLLEFSTVILTGVVIYLMGRLGRLDTWFSFRWLQYLGRISYSLFLIHYSVSWCVTTLGYRLTGDAPWPAVFWLIAALSASIVAAHFLYHYVEVPSLGLAARLKSPAAPRDLSQQKASDNEKGAT